MEKQKKQLFGLLAVLVVAVIAFFGLSKFSVADETEASEDEAYTVNAIEADNVTGFIFTNTNDTVSLTKDGDEWIYESDKSLDLDESKVSSLISNVAPLTSQDCIENVDDLSVYGLDNPVRTIVISDGDNTCTIFVGDFNDMTDTYYICLESDMNTVYTAEYNTVYAFETSVDDLVAEEEETETETETVEETETETETVTSVE